MSEYQYYEFRAIDRPLTDKEMAELRVISTRARITPSGFVNAYEYGDLKADPDKLLLKYFDAHVYLANWYTMTFMIRIPEQAMDASVLGAFAKGPCLHAVARKGFWVIHWHLDEAQDLDRFEEWDGSEWMPRLAPIREEIMQGDFRSLYMGWLAGAYQDIEIGRKNRFEPMALPGLGELTATQKALVEFLEVDADMLAGAAIGMPSRTTAEEGQAVDAFTASLPTDALRRVAAQTLHGESRQAEMDLRAQFAAWKREHGESAELPPRSCKTLLELTEEARELREKNEEAARARTEAKFERERKARLARLAADFPGAWKEAGRVASMGSGRAYDIVCQSLLELAAAYEAHASRAKFDEALKVFMRNHSRRQALIRRLRQAKLYTWA